MALTASHTYETDFNGWITFDKGVGCTVALSESPDVVKEVHGLCSSDGSYNYNLSGVSGKHIDYITFGKPGMSSAPYGNFSGLTTFSPLFSSRYVTLNEASFPAYNIMGNSSHYGSIRDVSRLDKLIGASGITSMSVSNMQDLVYAYIPSSLAVHTNLFVNCPNIEIIDI